MKNPRPVLRYPNLSPWFAAALFLLPCCLSSLNCSGGERSETEILLERDNKRLEAAGFGTSQEELRAAVENKENEDQYRILALSNLARQDINSNLRFIGMVGLKDQGPVGELASKIFRYAAPPESFGKSGFDFDTSMHGPSTPRHIQNANKLKERGFGIDTTSLRALALDPAQPAPDRGLALSVLAGTDLDNNIDLFRQLLSDPEIQKVSARYVLLRGSEKEDFARVESLMVDAHDLKDRVDYAKMFASARDARGASVCLEGSSASDESIRIRSFLCLEQLWKDGLLDVELADPTALALKGLQDESDGVQLVALQLTSGLIPEVANDPRFLEALREIQASNTKDGNVRDASRLLEKLEKERTIR